MLLLKMRYRDRFIVDMKEIKRPPYIGKRVSICIERGCKLILTGGGYISDDCQIAVMDGAYAVIGRKVYLGKGCRIFVRKDFRIGSYTLLADNVSIYDHNHRFRDKKKPIALQGYSSAPISVGSNCWLCTNVVVTKGSKIEDGVIVGANAVVNGICKMDCVYKCSDLIVVQ